EGWNGLGGRGVLPNGKLIGMNYLGDSTTQTDPNNIIVYGMPGSGTTDSDYRVTFNRSYGFSVPVLFDVTEIDETIISYPTKFLRNGKGALNIKANGNDFDGSGNYPISSALCELQQDGIQEDQSAAILLSCTDGNWDYSNASFYSISIGAVNTDGAHTSYSTAGSNLWVSSPAGEYGDFEPAMITTDQTTCLRGYAGWSRADSFASVNGAFLGSFGIDAYEFYANVFP